MSKVRVIVDSTFRHGVTLTGSHSASAAYDDAAGSPEPQWSTLTLKPGVNEVDEAEINAWRARAADAGLIFSKASNCLVLTNGIAADSATPEDILDRALRSSITVVAR